MLTPEEIDTLEDKLHVFVFSRGQVLARETEPIDYVGVIAEGRAISKSRHYQIGDLIGHSQVLGFDQKHTESITGESDGVIIAIRLYDLNNLPKPSLSNKITSHLSEVYTN
jgi:signal-transduction protein with cAMP-binding, CBS, and nucleotidyltransferase domain